MPSFNRRGFLQLLSAAGAAPLMPALPAGAVSASAKTSVSKALWSGIYAKSGSATKFVSVARNMGLPSSAIQGVSARSVGVRIAVVAAANPIGQSPGAGHASLPSTTPANTEAMDSARNFVRDLRRSLSDSADGTVVVVDEDAETLGAAGVSDTPDEGAV